MACWLENLGSQARWPDFGCWVGLGYILPETPCEVNNEMYILELGLALIMLRFEDAFHPRLQEKGLKVQRSNSLWTAVARAIAPKGISIAHLAMKLRNLLPELQEREESEELRLTLASFCTFSNWYPCYPHPFKMELGEGGDIWNSI